jgi:RNA polymerase sigma-70 factor (ECF subfamily)
MRAMEVDPEYEKERLEKLDKCMEDLPIRCKEVFYANKISGLKYQEVSEKLRISMKTVEGHITKAYRFLKECLNG